MKAENDAGLSSGRPSYQVRQFDEVGHAKVGAALGQDYHRILGTGIGPARRQATGFPLLVQVDDPILTPELPVVDQLILMPIERVEWMRHPKTSALNLRIRCI